MMPLAHSGGLETCAHCGTMNPCEVSRLNHGGVISETQNPEKLSIIGEVPGAQAVDGMTIYIESAVLGSNVRDLRS